MAVSLGREKPADLRAKYTQVINLKTARTLGLEIPRHGCRRTIR
ncbi:MAG TPA: hypothetical protein VH684_01610 [Xanthobacteraceae bacterium]|jgi:hypothetical protein